MNDRTLRVVGSIALVALGLLIVSMKLLVPLDAGVWWNVLMARGCTTDMTVDRLVRVASRTLGVMVVVAALLRARRESLRAVWPAIALVLLGALANDTMKHVFARERPSNLPGVAEAHGFPSGHTMNSAIAALAIAVLVTGFRRPLFWRATAFGLLAVVAAGRILVADHWLLDGVGSLLTATALAGLMLPAVRRRPLAAPAALAAVLAVVLGAATLMPTWRVSLPSPLVSETVEVDAELGQTLGDATFEGNWVRHVREEPAGGVSWLRGAASVNVMETTWIAGAKAMEEGKPLPEPSTPTKGRELLIVTARPDVRTAACTRVRLAVNGHIVAGFIPFRGWREYRVPLPDGTFRRGYNDVQFSSRVEGTGTPAELAVSRIRMRLK
jgi:membrane-associated phospholipid phosphatase